MLILPICGPCLLSFIHVIILKIYVFCTAYSIRLICGLFLCHSYKLSYSKYMFSVPHIAFVLYVVHLLCSLYISPVLIHQTLYGLMILLVLPLMPQPISSLILTSLSKPPFPDRTSFQHMWSLCCINFIHMSKRSPTFTCHMFNVPLAGQCVQGM